MLVLQSIDRTQAAVERGNSNGRRGLVRRRRDHHHHHRDSSSSSSLQLLVPLIPYNLAVGQLIFSSTAIASSSSSSQSSTSPTDILERIIVLRRPRTSTTTTQHLLPTNGAAMLHRVHLFIVETFTDFFLHQYLQHQQPIFWIPYYSYDDHDDDDFGTVLVPTTGAAVSHRVHLLIVESFSASSCISIINIITSHSVSNTSFYDDDDGDISTVLLPTNDAEVSHLVHLRIVQAFAARVAAASSTSSIDLLDPLLVLPPR